MATTRNEYMEMCGYCLSEEECIKLFDRTKDDLLEGTATWNEALEFAYNEWICEEEYAAEHENDEDDIVKGFNNNMPCDDTDYCSSSCPNYYKCH